MEAHITAALTSFFDMILADIKLKNDGAKEKSQVCEREIFFLIYSKTISFTTDISDVLCNSVADNTSYAVVVMYLEEINLVLVAMQTH